MSLVYMLPAAALLVVAVLVYRRVRLRALRWFMAVQGASLLGALVGLAMEKHNRDLGARVLAAIQSGHQPPIAELLSVIHQSEVGPIVRGYIGTALFLGLSLAFFIALLREVRELQAAQPPIATETPVPPCM
jgi:hypothetical protein